MTAISSFWYFRLLIYTHASLAPLAAVVLALTAECQLRETKHGSVCVCNSSYCDYLQQPQLTDDGQIVVISSSQVSRSDELDLTEVKNLEFYRADCDSS